MADATDDDALVEAVRKALQSAWIGGQRIRFSDEYADIMARAALAVAVPVVKERERGRCAKLAEDCVAAFLEAGDRPPVKKAVARHISATIRAQGEG
jgi:hypothetical protein